MFVSLLWRLEEVLYMKIKLKTLLRNHDSLREQLHQQQPTQGLDVESLLRHNYCYGSVEPTK